MIRMSYKPPINNPFDDTQLSRPEDFLTTEQRLDAIAEILATIALRALKQKEDEVNS
jgi:hypothetical protein